MASPVVVVMSGKGRDSGYRSVRASLSLTSDEMLNGRKSSDFVTQISLGEAFLAMSPLPVRRLFKL